MEPLNPIATCSSMLSLRRFAECRHFARCLPPSHSSARILAVADVLSAPDFYSVLHLRPSDAAATRDLARRQYVKLALLLDPTSPDKLPFSDEALARVQEAWHVLSHPERRALHDLHLHRTAAAAATFWTACPYCWNLFEYPKSYHGCALLCQVCAKSFHGESVRPPLKLGDAVVEGEQLRQYYSCEASVPLMYFEVQTEGGKCNDAEQPVCISDDDDEGLGFFRNEGKRRLRVKTVAKKPARNRTRMSLHSDSDLDIDLGLDDGELEFTAGDDDVFVGVRIPNN